MNKKAYIIAMRLWNRTNYNNYREGYEDILSLLSESTEGVSTAYTESSDLHGVRECNANDKTDESTDAVVAGRLEKITDDEKRCECGVTKNVFDTMDWRCHGCEHWND